MQFGKKTVAGPLLATTTAQAAEVTLTTPFRLMALTLNSTSPEQRSLQRTEHTKLSDWTEKTTERSRQQR
ncbi:hypothetical protein C5D35_02615 [Rathayibacter toxicus]|nr:hypothetical protein C5D35_02615 [Rathayibacter toxicus]